MIIAGHTTDDNNKPRHIVVQGDRCTDKQMVEQTDGRTTRETDR